MSITVDTLFEGRGRWQHLPSIVDRIDASGDCWIWTGASTTLGYGCVGVEGSQRLVHRVVYEALVGPIPDGLELDHLCRRPPCVNPDHLEPVTHQENIRRGAPTGRRPEHCKRGHRFTEDNTYRFPGGRGCRECRRSYGREWARRQRQEA